MKQTNNNNNDFVLIGSTPTTIPSSSTLSSTSTSTTVDDVTDASVTVEDENKKVNPAYETVYMQGGKRFLFVNTIHRNKIYNILYSALPKTYNKYLPIVRTMINSFKFLS